MAAGHGRPRQAESARRRREFIKLLSDGQSWRDAARQARVKPDAVLTMLDQPEFQAVAAALLDGRAEIAIVTVAPAVEQAA